LEKNPSGSEDDCSKSSPKVRSESFGEGSAMEICIKFLVNKGEAGSIIGRKGSRIVALQKTYQVRAKLSTELSPKYPGTNFRIGMILGERLENVKDAITSVLNTVSIPNSDNPESGEIKETKTVQFILLIPQSSSGGCIGKGGSIVRDIQKKTTAKISIEDSRDAELAGTKERMVTVTGAQESVSEAIKCILDCLDGVDRGFDYIHKGVKYFHARGNQFNNGGGPSYGGRPFYGNYDGGRSDRHHRFLVRPADPMPRQWNRAHPGPHPYHNAMPWRNDFRSAMPMNEYGYIPSERPAPRNSQSMHHRGGQGSMESGDASEIEFMSPAVGNMQFKRVAIEEKWVGAVIGKNGVTIKRIQHSCGVSVKVENREKSSGDRREILISGRLEGIEQAQSMIWRIMGDAMNRAMTQGMTQNWKNAQK
jgi:predicted RNA-binding protein YlqC (UPF0109 family)